MKAILKTAAAVVAIMGVTSAQAQSTTTSSTTYSAPGVAPTVYFLVPGLPVVVSPGVTPAQQFAAGSGSRYDQSTSSPNNSEANSMSVTNTFTLSGNVTKDCSFYGGGSTSHSINLGTIGVRTGNNDNVSVAFNQNDTITANVNSATAGCNTSNTVTISKGNGNIGLLNSAAGSFDSAQFTDRIPYTIAASWTGVAAGVTADGTAQSLFVPPGAFAANTAGGAWRSAFNMNVTAHAQSKGLVAGDYTDTITVTLAAI